MTEPSPQISTNLTPLQLATAMRDKYPDIPAKLQAALRAKQEREPRVAEALRERRKAA